MEDPDQTASSALFILALFVINLTTWTIKRIRILKQLKWRFSLYNDMYQDSTF